jgi:hypothetical protein
MSGFDAAHSGTFELTPTKVAYWHRARGVQKPPPCPCKNAGEMVRNHLGPLEGWTVVDKGSFWQVRGPGLDEGWTSDLYAALAGKAGQRDPSRQWSH